MKTITYRCEACGQTVEIIDGEMDMPECCQKPMIKDKSLDFCEKPSTPEFARMADNDAPCDDGRSGRI